jgi:pyruvate, water dikinase
VAADRFPSPFEIPVPPGAEGWEDLYSYADVFSQDRRAYEDGQFWFQDSVHWGWALTPFDATLMTWCLASLSQYNSRIFRIPPSQGVDARILYGYCYLSPVEIADGGVIESRVPQFMERAGHYFANWDSLYEQWLTKVKENIAELQALDLSPLPETDDLEIVTEGRGVSSGWQLLADYRRFKDLTLKVWQLHFEFLNLGYAAYLDYFGFCKQAWPNIPDLAIASMVSGIEVDLFRPNEELKKLAQLAVDLGIVEQFADEDVAAVRSRLAESDAGSRWLAAWDEVKEPWFNFSDGTGFYHFDSTWIDKPEVPFGFLRTYIEKIQAGEDISRPMAEIQAERDRLVEEYTDLLDTDEDRQAFAQKLGLARTVFPYVENHNFYIEHWSMSVWWRKLRELGATLAKERVIDSPDDVFMFKIDEIDEVLYDLFKAWAVAGEPRGTAIWPAKLAERRRIYEALKRWSPPKALGKPPEVVTEPFTVMLWGITSDSVSTWLGADEPTGSLSGMAASPGVVEGTARVLFSADEIGEVRDGDILVAPITAPSWAPVFAKIKATVTDIGGVMSHAAIVCREYQVPAVTGTGYATRDIKTGQRIRVDGNTGIVTILDDDVQSGG